MDESLMQQRRVESGPCLSSSVAGHPLRPARDRRLGGPLPRLLANPIWAHPMARGPKIPRFLPQDVCGISVPFDTLSPTTWARSDALLTRSPLAGRPKPPLPFDLHV